MTEHFLCQGQDEIGVWKDNVCQQFKLLGSSTRCPCLAIELNGIPYISLNDLLGNIICLTNLEGNVIERYGYSAFGETAILDHQGNSLADSSINNPWQYSGKRLDQETGLIAFGLRYYQPGLGRWLTPDPAGFADGPNLYAYVHNSPLVYFDPFGLRP